MFYWVVKAILLPLLSVLFRPWAEGTDNVPRSGPAILASNHLSFSDHFFAPLPLPRKVVFLAKSEYFTGRGIKGLFSRAFFSGVGQIPVDRSGGKASERALATGLRVLAGGQLLGIYPEGTRTPDGRLFRGKTGVARLALEARVPVVPCAMIGGFEFQPPGKITPRFKVRPGVRFGKPLDFTRYYGMENDRMVLRAVTDEIIYEIMKLSGQEYVDEYASQHKARKQAEKKARKHDSSAKGAAGAAEPAPAPGPSSVPASASSVNGSPVTGPEEVVMSAAPTWTSTDSAATGTSTDSAAASGTSTDSAATATSTDSAAAGTRTDTAAATGTSTDSAATGTSTDSAAGSGDVPAAGLSSADPAAPKPRDTTATG